MICCHIPYQAYGFVTESIAPYSLAQGLPQQCAVRVTSLVRSSFIDQLPVSYKHCMIDPLLRTSRADLDKIRHDTQRRRSLGRDYKHENSLSTLRGTLRTPDRSSDLLYPRHHHDDCLRGCAQPQRHFLSSQRSPRHILLPGKLCGLLYLDGDSKNSRCAIRCVLSLWRAMHWWFPAHVELGV